MSPELVLLVTPLGFVLIVALGIRVFWRHGKSPWDPS